MQNKIYILMPNKRTQRVKRCGLQLALILESFCARIYSLCPLNIVGNFIHFQTLKIERVAYWLFGVFYKDSEEEIRDAINLAFGDDWKCYTETQIKIINFLRLQRQFDYE